MIDNNDNKLNCFFPFLRIGDTCAAKSFSLCHHLLRGSVRDSYGSRVYGHQVVKVSDEESYWFKNIHRDFFSFKNVSLNIILPLSYFIVIISYTCT